jgi:para-aminobenzoate synthetase
VSGLESFRKVADDHERCFWLDGGGSQSWSGRRSIVGRLEDDDLSLTYDATRREVVEHPSGRVVGDDVFTVLQELQDGDADTHWVGYFGYAARPDLPARSLPGVPDAIWMRTRAVEMTDEPARLAQRSSEAPAEQRAPRWYNDAFAAVQEQLRAGNSYEVNLTYRSEHDSAAEPVDVYGRLRTSEPAPYAGVLRHGDTWLLSASPERFATVDRHRRVEARPIKGTTPRGVTPEQDEALRHSLATDPRFRAENLMITDLLRNDLAMVCEPGSVVVPELMTVESYASVHQLVTTVAGRLRDEVGTVEALRAMFPAGSMTGAPKLRTMQIIDTVETSPRGVYAGAFGWISGDGRADLGVVIRSLFRSGAGPWLLGTGGGITVHSEVGDEYAESQLKAERLLRALSP